MPRNAIQSAFAALWFTPSGNTGVHPNAGENPREKLESMGEPPTVVVVRGRQLAEHKEAEAALGRRNRAIAAAKLARRTLSFGRGPSIRSGA